jgi:MYXO-CTERM domain-containing protein
MAGEEIAPRAAGQGQPIEGRPVQVSSNGQLSQAQLQAQIERAQAELGRTVDAIADKVKPANVARRATDQLRQRIATVDPKLVGVGAAVVVGLVGLAVWRRRRRR